MSEEHLRNQYGSDYVKFRGYPNDQLVPQLRRHFYGEFEGNYGGGAASFPLSLVENAKRENDGMFVWRMAESVGQIIGGVHGKLLLDARDIRALANIAVMLPYVAEPYNNGLAPNPAEAVRDLALRLVQPDLNPSEVDQESSENRTGKLLLYVLSTIQPTEGEDSQNYLDLWTRLWGNLRRSDLWTFSFTGLSRFNWDAALERLPEFGQRAQKEDTTDVSRSWNPRAAIRTFLGSITVRSLGSWNRFCKMEEWFVQRSREAKESNDDQAANYCLTLVEIINNLQDQRQAVPMYLIRHRVKAILEGRDDLEIPPVDWDSPPEEIAIHSWLLNKAVRREAA